MPIFSVAVLPCLSRTCAPPLLSRRPLHLVVLILSQLLIAVLIPWPFLYVCVDLLRSME